MATVYFARWILLPEGDVLENGGLSVDHGVITSVDRRSRVRRSSTDRSVNLGDLLLMPGFVNIHTHLEEGVLRGMPHDAGESFASRFSKKNSRLRQASVEALRSAVRLGVLESLSHGTTTVVDSSRRGVSAGVLADEPIRSWVVHELHADDSEQEEGILDLLNERLGASRDAVNIGVGPYALFSLSPENQRAVVALAKERQYRWLTHMAESAEELQAFCEQNNDLYFHLTRRRPWQHGRNPMGPMYYALTNNLVPNGGICVHCNYVNGYELSLLAAKHVAVAVSSRYTMAHENKHLPLEIALKRGICLCAATESVADSGSMNLFDELFHLKRLYPHVPAREMLAWVTRNPADALGAGDAIGSLAEGKRADVIGVAFAHSPDDDLLEDLVEGETSVRFVMVDGEEVIAGY